MKLIYISTQIARLTILVVGMGTVEMMIKVSGHANASSGGKECCVMNVSNCQWLKDEVVIYSLLIYRIE